MDNRRGGSADELNFVDPLSNYDPPVYSDALERALAEIPVSEIESRPFVAVAPTTTIRSAIDTMARLEVACLLVTDDGKLQGVFTERDVLDKVSENYGALADRPVSSVMTANPTFVYQNDSSAAAVCVMSACGYRHVPVLNASGHVTGVVSPQRVLGFLVGHMGD